MRRPRFRDALFHRAHTKDGLRRVEAVDDVADRFLERLQVAGCPNE